MPHGHDFDLVTIGAGSGGVAASRRAAARGARVAIVEAGRVGGTCVLRGCVPKKILVYAASVRAQLEDAAGLGWSIAAAELSWPKLQAAKDRELDRLEGVYRHMLSESGVELVVGRGTLVDGNTVAVDGRRIRAAHVLLATGGSPERLDVPGAELGITSDEALSLPEVPRRLVVVGSGYIGVELSSVYAAVGSAVTVLVRGDGVLTGFDEDVRSDVLETMRGRGIEVRTQTRIERVSRRGSELELVLSDGNTVATDVLLWAVGRRPNTRALGLEEVGIATDATGAIIVDRWSCTGVPSVFAVGDCTVGPALTPVAIADGRGFADSRFSDHLVAVERTLVPTAVFGQPPVGTVGFTEAQARAAHPDDVQVFRTRFRPMPHALTGRRERTLMKIIVQRSSDRVLGIHIVGPDAPEIVQGFAAAMQCGATKRMLDATLAIHPTAAEELVTMYTPVA